MSTYMWLIRFRDELMQDDPRLEVRRPWTIMRSRRDTVFHRKVLSLAFFKYLERSADNERETLARVCRAWKAVVADSPILSNRIVLDILLMAVRDARPKQLQGARRAPLAVSIRARPRHLGHAMVAAAVQDACDLVKRHPWRQLFIDPDSPSKYFVPSPTSNPRDC